MMQRFPKAKRRAVGVNIVPLVDVLIILLFFFALTSRMPSEDQKTMNILLPTMQTAGCNQLKTELMIGIDAKGQFYLDAQSVSKEELLTGIYMAAEIQKDRPVLILADERSHLEQLAFVMDACRKNGLEKVRLQTR